MARTITKITTVQLVLGLRIGRSGIVNTLLLTLFAMLTCVLGQLTLRPENILLTNTGINVPFGRSTTIDPRYDLQIFVQPGDRCVVRVLNTDALSQKPGRISPSSFPCNFYSGQVQYSHFGSRHPTEDRIRLLIRYDSHNETVIIPLTVQVNVDYTQLQVVTKNMPITVHRRLGVSTPIDRTVMEFTYDRSHEICKVTVLGRETGVPKYGRLMNDTSNLHMIDCDDFLQMGIVYKHTARRDSPRKDYIPLVVEIMEADGTVIKEEFFQVMVRIRDGEENTQPQASFDAVLILEVDQFVMTAITSEILAAEDTETPPNELIFNITQPLGIGEGEIVSTDDRNLRIKSFRQKDVEDLKIAYKPPRSDSKLKRIYQVEFEVVDSEGLTSDPFTLMILVEPMNTLAPVVTKNAGIQLFEGQSRPLISLQNLAISDENDLENVRVTVTGGLRHGELILPHGQNFFTARDLEEGSVIYLHDGSESNSDNIIFQMSDGVHEVEFLFPVTIYPEDDEPPVLSVNTGMEIHKNQLSEISPFVLGATDIDSEDSFIRYVLEPPFSKEGVIVKRQFKIPRDPQNWQYNNGIYEKVVEQFTQQDIVDGELFYRHVGQHHTDFFMDKMKFKLLDNGNPPNESPVHEFVVKIQPVDDQPPYLYPNTPLQMDVDEFQMTNFRRKFFRYTDDDTDDRQLQFKVTRPPFDTDHNTNLNAGIIVLCDDPRTMISLFSQAQVSHHKICYHPPSSELGLMPRIIQFVFDVQDISGNIFRNQVFTIFLKPINNKPPIVTNAGLNIYEGSMMIITPQMLDVDDPDSEMADIVFIVTEEPEHGVLKKGATGLEVGDHFSRNDIGGGQIAYFNTGHEMKKDQFCIDVADGVHFVSIKFKINVKSVDDEPPQLIGVDSEVLVVHLEVPEGGTVPLTSKDIKASDPDTDDLLLIFMIEKQPNDGVVIRGNQRTDRFTQQDVINGIVSYQHIAGEIGDQSKSDEFTLILTDTSHNYMVAGNQISHILVHVKILPVDNIAPTVTFGAPFEVLESGKGPILPMHVDASDKDTNDNELLCTIVVQPANGFLENLLPAPGSEKSRAGMPISAFSIQDVRLGNINYVQSVHKGVEPREDQFTFTCSDGVNHSPNYILKIAIYPANDEEPQVFMREFVVAEGMILSIDLPILNAIDLDVPVDTLTFIVTKAPEHGEIVQQKSSGVFPVNKFTLEDISGSSTIVYEHDDSETTKDSFDFILTDGKYNVSQTVLIMIILVDDETPRLTINNGIEVEDAGGRVIIDNQHLKAEDLDSPDINITFIIRRIPKHGYILKKSGQRFFNLTTGSNFTQGDIDENRVEYVHTGLEGGRDLIKFDVTDGLNPLIDRYFYVSIEGVDTVYPVVINKGVELPEGGSVTLTTDLLRGTDLNTPDEHLEFTVTRVPTRGHLEHSNNPGVPITIFTQLDLAGSNIRYIHTSPDEMKMDSFEFEVTDGYNPVSRTFRISLSDVDNKKPVLMFGTLRLKEGENKVITPFELKAEDRDTEDRNIVFTVTEIPVHGNILYNFSRIVTSFTMADLGENRISYQHDGTETTMDTFSFTVTDGIHSDFYVFPQTSFSTRHPQEMRIQILPVDNAVPQISVNRGITALTPLKNGERGFQFTSKMLRTEDRDSPDDTLLYSLTSPPEHGIIVVRSYGKKGVGNWTQGDINRRKVEYVLRPGVNATEDSFFFKITDKGGNVLPNQPFHLNWAWISLEADRLAVNETEEHLEVTLRRRGYLGETAFITITVINGTAKVGEDVRKKYAKQVQFNPGQAEKSWHIRIKNDAKFEGPETFQLNLSDPVNAILEYPDIATVTIQDQEDESTVSFAADEYEVSEDIGEIHIPIHRTGDLSDEFMVICSTYQGSATGTVPNTVLSYSDYITRPEDHRSVIRFDKGEKEKYCRVMIIDDSLFEEDEDFQVALIEPVGGRLGKINTTTVIIEPDKEDEPVFYFGNAQYSVDESNSFVEIKVWRVGTDLNKPSSVTVRSRRSDPQSAEAGIDYIAVNRILEFSSGVTMQTIKITILDDLGRPQLEGEETFEVVLRMPVKASLGEPSVAVITITDSVSDVPKMQFKDALYNTNEKEDNVTAYITRSGDLSHISTVRCYTRQASAEVMIDYEERTDTNSSVVIFFPGDREKPCVVNLVDDHIHESEEEFRLMLGTPDSPTAGNASIGFPNATLIKIKDNGDSPVIRFDETKYTITEPMFKGELEILEIPVIRDGDTTETSVVMVHTKDGSAKAGKDYNGLYKELVFGKGVSKHLVEVEIRHNEEKENREVFTIHLKADRNMIAKVKDNKALVFIEEKNTIADVVFPAPPQVVSLRDYDDAENADENPVQGYPVICITPCNPKHPDFAQTGTICKSQDVNDTLTRFRWRVSAPSGLDGVTSEIRDVESHTFFASTRKVTLDSIYFGGGSRVQCVARAVNVDGDPGHELESKIITISKSDGLCMPRIMDSVGAEPYIAKLRYTGPGNPDFPNHVRVSITIPHRDGMLPIVSTRQLSNFELTLSPDAFRIGLHRCSNLLDYDEVPTEYGFLTNATRNLDVIREVEPYQYSNELRSQKTLRFYRNLDLEACLWELEAYFDMSELVSDCGGKIETDGQVLNLKQSYVSVNVPLFISYIFHSPVATGGWQHYDMASNLKLTFVYDTAILWQNGVSSPSSSSLKGYLYPTSMRINDDGTLAVNFRTEARFRGQFVQSHPGTKMESLVMSPDHPGITHNLKLIRSEPTFEQPEQLWEFVTDYAVKDYSGLYKIKLVPCTTSVDQEYNIPLACNPRDPVTFDLPIRFQQVSDPVAAKFSLNTDFHLMRKRDLWLSDGSVSFGEESDAAFTPGDRIMGRINVDSVHNLGDEFLLNIEKVFLCSGNDGYVPKYDPENQEYGCVAETNDLQHTFKILDKGAPHTCQTSFNNVDFQALLAIDDSDAIDLVRQAGSDGFSMDTQPLFKVDSGRQWYLHVIYTLRSKENAARGIGKRSVEYGHIFRRAIDDIKGVGETGKKGTNMAHVSLNYQRVPRDKTSVKVDTTDEKGSIPLVPVLIGIGILLLICLLIAIIFVRRHRKRSTPPPSPSNTITVIAPKGNSRVVHVNHLNNDPDTTEV